jgi:hypothetical protein
VIERSMADLADSLESAADDSGPATSKQDVRFSCLPLAWIDAIQSFPEMIGQTKSTQIVVV